MAVHKQVVGRILVPLHRDHGLESRRGVIAVRRVGELEMIATHVAFFGFRHVERIAGDRHRADTGEIPFTGIRRAGRGQKIVEGITEETGLRVTLFQKL